MRIGNAKLELYPREWVDLQLSKLTPAQRQDVFEYCGISPSKNQYANNETALIVMKAVQITNDENYGHCKTVIPAGSIEFVLRVMEGTDNVTDAIEIMIKFTNRYFPTRKLAIQNLGDFSRLTVSLDGLDDESGASAELLALIGHLHGLGSFAGRPLKIRRLHSRSKLFTRAMDYNIRLDAEVQYSEFTGVDIERESMGMLKTASLPGDPMVKMVQWLFLIHKVKAIAGNSDIPVLRAESMLKAIEKISAQRNVDLRQKRRISYGETDYCLRDLQSATKIARAIILLSTTNIKTSEIATKLEFSDFRSFHRFFQNYSSLTPAEYRELYRDEMMKDGCSAMSLAMRIVEDGGATQAFKSLAAATRN